MIQGTITQTTVALDKLKKGQQARIVAIDESLCPPHPWADGEWESRLVEMGLSENRVVCVAHFGPLGDPIALDLEGGHRVALRRQDAAAVLTVLENEKPSQKFAQGAPR
jgi:Fe2+ transport system protein FeoA